MLMQKQQQQEQPQQTPVPQPEQQISPGEEQNPSSSVVGTEESVGTDSGNEQSNSSLPALAVAAVNACDSPSFLTAKAMLQREKKSGEMARVRRLKPLSPITVPQRAIGTDFGNSPSSGSPTPTDFSPMLLPKAEENLTALISEHNQQKRQLQMQQLQQQQLQLQVQQFQQQQLQLQLQQQQRQSQEQQRLIDMQLHALNGETTVPQPPPAKRLRLSRGRKRQTENPAAGTQIGLTALAMIDPVNGVMRGPQRRSSLGSTSVSVDPEEGITDGTTMRKGPWLAAEDEKLLQLVEKYGAHDWSFIAEHIRGRVGKQCRERYFNHLAPDVRKEAWTDREDDAIVHAHHVVGNKWTNIAKILGNGRSPNSIKNRWHSSLKNRLGEHGGETAVLEATGASKSCQCECKHCECSCKVTCVAFRCQCCFAAHHPGVSEPAEDTQTNSVSIATDDDSPRSASST